MHDYQGVSDDLKPPREPFSTSTPGNEPRSQKCQCLSILVLERNPPDTFRESIKDPSTTKIFNMTINSQMFHKNKHRYLTLDKQNSCLTVDSMFHLLSSRCFSISHILSIWVHYFLVQFGLLKVPLF